VTGRGNAIDAPLVAGAAIFGTGWGLGGYCPGPALTALSNLTLEPLVFVAAMIAGGLAHKLAFDRPAEAGNIHASESEAEYAP